jgi:hypothetical protein
VVDLRDFAVGVCIQHGQPAPNAASAEMSDDANETGRYKQSTGRKYKSFVSHMNLTRAKCLKIVFRAITWSTGEGLLHDDDDLPPMSIWRKRSTAVLAPKSA